MWIQFGFRRPLWKAGGCTDNPHPRLVNRSLGESPQKLPAAARIQETLPARPPAREQSNAASVAGAAWSLHGLVVAAQILAGAAVALAAPSKEALSLGRLPLCRQSTKVLAM